MKAITCQELANICIASDLIYFSGVPDSTFKEWLSYVARHPSEFRHCIAANEGAAVAHVVGYHLCTGKIGIAYMQNSGLGNCVNPLTSLADDSVFGIPMILMIGWRGEPGIPDEPQHQKMGKMTLPLLTCLDISFLVLGDVDIKEQITKAKQTAQKMKKPFALILKKGIFDDKPDEPEKDNQPLLTKEGAMLEILNHFDGREVVVATTGKISRELYVAREVGNLGHGNDFYTIGSMGHAGAIALEIARQKAATRIFVFDGDGAVIMHLGTLGTIGHYQPANLVHIVFDNGCHESTGGQPTISRTMDLRSVALGCGYKAVEICTTKEDLRQTMASLKSNGPTMVVIKVGGSSQESLGRPTLSPPELKKLFMDRLKDLT